MKPLFFAICCFLTLQVCAKDVPMHMPQNATRADREAFAKEETWRKQRALVEELEQLGKRDFGMVLYAINPKEDRNWAIDGKEESVDVFRGYPILGKAQITEATDRQLALKSLIRGIKESDGSVAMCFEPRHAITITFGERKIDVLVCFTCLSASVWGAYGANGFLTSSSPQKEYDELLKKYGLPRTP